MKLRPAPCRVTEGVSIDLEGVSASVVAGEPTYCDCAGRLLLDFRAYTFCSSSWMYAREMCSPVAVSVMVHSVLFLVHGPQAGLPLSHWRIGKCQRCYRALRQSHMRDRIEVR